MAEDANATPAPMYAGPIHDAARSGDLARMRDVQAKGEQHLREVEAALAELRGAIQRHNG